MIPIIQTPRGAIKINEKGKAELVWNTQFAQHWQLNYSRAQMFVDSEVLRRSEPYIPLKTGTLIKSGILGTKIGEGLVQWIAPYAKAQYYFGRIPGQSATGTKRGRLWFERMKAVAGRNIIADAKKFLAQNG